MSNNIPKYTTNYNNGVIDGQYRKALRLENAGIYKDAIELYKINIERFNDSGSKIRLAKLYLEGKVGKIDNKLARDLLEEAYNQGDENARQLLAYTYSNGIGGEKREAEAYSMFIKELEDSNPDPMVYMELLKLMPRDKSHQELIKSFKKTITNVEKRNYRRKVSIDKFNNTKLGRVVNFIPNIISRTFEDYIEDRKNRKIEYSLGDLYDKAKEYQQNGDDKTARRIYKRLTNYGDKDASLKYARMLTLGIGGPKDIESAKNIYNNLILKSNNKLDRISKKISDLDSIINSRQSSSVKRTRKSKKEDERILEEIAELEERRDKIIYDNVYNEACLKYGLLLVDHPRNESEFNDGINLLKSFSDGGDFIPGKGKRLSKIGEKLNKRAQIAISKLGKLYESGKWKPENLEEERLNFLRFSSGKAAQYASHISEQMKQDSEIVDENKEDVSTKKSKSKECKVRYELGTLCEFLHLNSFARKIFTSMSKDGDYSCSCALALMEQRGKGGIKDNESAKRHYREYIQHIDGEVDAITEKNKFMAVHNIADILLEEKDVKGAVELYKISAKRGLKQSKRALRFLNEEGLWNPETEMEEEWIKQKGISKVIGTIKSKIPEFKVSPKVKFKAKQALAASVVLATATATTSYVMSENISVVAGEPQSYVDEDNNNRSYTIGDEIFIGDDKENSSQIIGLVAYNPEDKKVVKNKDFNLNNFGLSSNDYLEEIAKGNNLDKKHLRVLYCVRNGDKIVWVSPERDELEIYRPYIVMKKEDDIQEFC